LDLIRKSWIKKKNPDLELDLDKKIILVADMRGKMRMVPGRSGQEQLMEGRVARYGFSLVGTHMGG
jgi:hypothetical protein